MGLLKWLCKQIYECGGTLLIMYRTSYLISEHSLSLFFSIVSFKNSDVIPCSLYLHLSNLIFLFCPKSPNTEIRISCVLSTGFHELCLFLSRLAHGVCMRHVPKPLIQRSSRHHELMGPALHIKYESGKRVWQFLQKLNREFPHDPTFPYQGTYLK